jgi:FlaA1/EpsC-like NDP-sugar epimerase
MSKILRKTVLKRRAFFFLSDFLLISGAMYLAIWIRFNGNIPSNYMEALPYYIFFALAFKMIFLVLFNLYDISWRYCSLDVLIKVFKAISVGSLCLGVFVFLLRLSYPFASAAFPRSVLFLDYMFSLIFVGTLRAAKRVYHEGLHRTLKKKVEEIKVLVIGAGSAGEIIVREMKRKKESPYVPVGFIDDDPGKQHIKIHEVKVLGTRKDLPRLIKDKNIDEILIAMPSAGSESVREILEILLKEKPIERIKILPEVTDLINGRITLTDIQEIKLEDLLGRSQVRVDMEAVSQFINGKTVLVTGAGGSIGSEIVNSILQFKPRKLIALDIDETELFYLTNTLKDSRGCLLPVVGDIRDEAKMESVICRYSPEIMLHAAAYKHVPMLECHPEEAVKTNVLGTKVLAMLALKYGMEKFIFISTDKAINPTSIMGVSKRSCEEMLKVFDRMNTTRFISVRFGNVLGSRGSVIPIFEEQIRKGGPVTVTHPEMRRYFMSNSEAVLLVLEAAAVGEGGEVFVLDMGEPIKIVDLAREMIRLSGYDPDVDIPIVFSGVRAGEKLFEEILGAEEGTEGTEYEKIFIAKDSRKNDAAELFRKIDLLIEMSSGRDEGRFRIDKINSLFREIVPTYTPNKVE